MSDVWRQGDYEISDDPARLQMDVVHGFLRTAYWSRGVPREVVERAARNSMCFGIYRGGEGGEEQVGFARVATDRAVLAFLMDVFVLEAHRGRGLARWLVATIRSHAELQGLRRWMLMTNDAHGVYERVGFRPCAHPERVMEIVAVDPYGADPTNP
jgi:GNAT superfamily N-acetyltransferase